MFPFQMTFTPNLIRQRTMQLRVLMWDSNDYIVDLEIKFNADVPKLECFPKEINIKFCFMTYPYWRTINLKNMTHLPGYFYVIPSGVR